MNLKRVMALVQTVAMVATLTVGITFATTEQTEAADNIQLSSPIEISAQKNEEAEYEFSVSETGYYKIYSEICEYEFYGTLYEKVNGEWKMLINDDDTHTNSNFVVKYAFHAGTDYKIKVREAENQQFNATIYVEKWEPDVIGVRSKKIYCNVGDDIELKPYLVVENEQVVEDLGVEGITVKWYKYTGKRYYDSGNDDYYYEYGDPVEVSSDGFILLNNLSEKDFYRNGDTSTYWTYAIYKNGKKIDESDAHISKEDADFSGVTEMKVVYANEGSSATLVPDVYENGTKVSLNKNYICEWSNEKDENLGTKLVYDISNVTAANIYSYQNPVSYYCDVYKVSYDGDGEYRERIGYTRFIIVRGNSQINQPNQPNQSGQPTTLPGQNNVTTPTTNNTVGNAAKDTTIKETVKGNVLKAGKGSIKISIKKIAKAKGYQVQVSTSKKFKKKVTITKITKKNSIVIKKLKKKKQYFVRTRSYTIVKKKKKFGKWSKIKAIKTK